MKQQILNLKKKLLLAELPERAYNIKVRFGKYLTYFKPFSKVVERFDYNIKSIDKLTDITEEQFRQWVDFVPIVVGLPCLTSKESFFSYLEAQGIYFENPFGKIEPELSEDDLWGDMAQDSQVYAGILYKKDKWQEAEEKVWNLNNCYIFEVL